MSWLPGDRAPSWWRSCPWRATEGLPQRGLPTLQRMSANVDDLLLSLSSRSLLLYGFENMIAKINIIVKLEPNEHLRKFLIAFSVQWWRKNDALDDDFRIFRTIRCFYRNKSSLKEWVSATCFSSRRGSCFVILSPPCQKPKVQVRTSFCVFPWPVKW